MADEASTKQTTEYVILEQQAATEEGAASSVVVRGQAEARSALDAIRAYANKNGAKGGTFYAVPARSWKPIKVAVETQTRLKLS